MNIKTKILLLLTLQAQYQSCKGINVNDKLQYSGYVVGTVVILYGCIMERNIGRQSQEAINEFLKSNPENNCACSTIVYDDDTDGCSICTCCGTNYKDKIMPVSKYANNKPYIIKISGVAILSANAFYHLITKLKSLYYKSSCTSLISRF